MSLENKNVKYAFVLPAFEDTSNSKIMPHNNDTNLHVGSNISVRLGYIYMSLNLAIFSY